MDNVIRLLAFSQYLCLKQASEDKYMSNEDAERLNGEFTFLKFSRLHQLLYEKLGFEFDPKDFAPKPGLIKKSSLFDFTYKNTLEQNKVAQKVKEFYGEDLYFIYVTVIFISNIYGASSAAELMIKEWEEDKNPPRDKVLRFKKLEREIIKIYKECSFLLHEQSFLSKYYDPQFIEQLDSLQKIINEQNVTLELLSSFHKQMTPLMQYVVPGYDDLVKREDIAFKLISELKAIKPGRTHWPKYETFCIKVLNYLFIPEFRKIYTQAKSFNGYERRDAIVPNNSPSRFWMDIKSEFSSKNIVFEFKNLSKGYSKAELNQLRIYLSKPTIGKFGILVVRENEEKQSLLQAQRDAYEQSGILILIVDDSVLIKLILSKAYFGTCDDIIANEKIKFEINY